MEIKNGFLFFQVSIIFSSFTFAVCQDNSNLKQIVDLEDELGIATPLQSSIVPLKSYFDVKAEPAHESCKDTEKLEIFNKNFLNYIREYYNKPEFTDVLTYDTNDICQFLQISSDFNLDPSATYVILRLFYNKIKSCDFIFSDAVNSVLESLNEHEAKFFITSTEDVYQEEIQAIRKNLEKIIFSQLNEQFAQNQALDASLMTKKITEDVFKFMQQSINNIQQKNESIKARERLRQMIKSFVDGLVGKTVWDEQKPEEIWSSFINISINLQKLCVNDIIDEMDDIDDLLWSLTHSFCRFFTSFGIAVPISIYEKIELDLKNNAVYFLEVPEQEDGIRTKKEHIYDALFKSKIKAYAFEKKGIIAQ
jgi:hypothetical protein